MASTEAQIGQMLRQIRRDHRLSLRHVAEQAGVSVATLSRVETNKQSVDVALLLALAEVLHVSAGDLLGEGKNAGGGTAALTTRSRPRGRSGRGWTSCSTPSTCCAMSS